jgi:thiamine biosynthesis lipoprotein
MMNRRCFLRGGLLAAPIIFSLSGCTTRKQAFHQTIAVFGTLVNITLYAEHQQQANQAFAAVNQRFSQIHHDWHAWEKGGLVSKINQAIADTRPIDIPSEVAEFIRLNQQLCSKTLGLFDPGIGQLVKLWGFHRDQFADNSSPHPDDVAKLLAQKPSILDIEWQGNQLFCSNVAVSLDFGASGKAYALDAATQSLAESGISQATIAIGGDIQVIGSKPDAEGWRVGINDPDDTRKAKHILLLQDGEAICSSGTYQRFYTDRGKKITHIIHPHTGQPVTHHLHSSVLNSQAILAEVGALSQLIATEAQWQKIAQNLELSLYYRLSARQEESISPALAQRIRVASGRFAA